MIGLMLAKRSILNHGQMRIEITEITTQNSDGRKRMISMEQHRRAYVKNNWNDIHRARDGMPRWKVALYLIVIAICFFIVALVETPY